MTTKSLLQKVFQHYDIQNLEQLSKQLDIQSDTLKNVIESDNLSEFISILNDKDADMAKEILNSFNLLQSINSVSDANVVQTNSGIMYFNKYIIINKNLSQKIKSSSTDIMLVGLLNYSKKFKNLTTFIYYIIIPFLVILLFYFENILYQQISFSALILIVLYFYIYYNHNRKATVTDNYIKIKNETMNFSEIRKMEFNEAKHINTVRIYGENDIYPSKILYSDKDTISVISEYYSDYVNKNSKKIYQE
ncbi:hypothetical protein [Arcobacter porcinus]|uniref:Putative membrane protein n=1 Tax=Arcobacter porcinus TaxID=1935204 RepID=A0A5C2HIV0_9BACT|nr:hypothetical protein [Arcobacter porcinus]OCL94312.1 hypothetical protein AAX27_01109 [Aliarcobacter thereius]QEP41012.1 putative membrane protein [Arcobacter porcinus]